MDDSVERCLGCLLYFHRCVGFTSLQRLGEHPEPSL